MAKGYGKLDPKYAKYFKGRSAPAVGAASRKAGPMDEGRRKPEEDEAEVLLQEMLDLKWEDKAVDTLIAGYIETLLGEQVRVMSGRHDGNTGTVCAVKQYDGVRTYGVAFEWADSEELTYFPEHELELL